MGIGVAATGTEAAGTVTDAGTDAATGATDATGATGATGAATEVTGTGAAIETVCFILFNLSLILSSISAISPLSFSFSVILDVYC